MDHSLTVQHEVVSGPINQLLLPAVRLLPPAPPISLLHALHLFFWKDRKVFLGSFRLQLRHTVCLERWDLEVCPPSSTRFTIGGNLKAPPPRHSWLSKPDQEFMSNPQHGVLVLPLKCELDFHVKWSFPPAPPTACCGVHANASANLFVLSCMKSRYFDEASAHLSA